jgi:hypothetical protein
MAAPQAGENYEACFNPDAAVHTRFPKRQAFPTELAL